jgi:uncharacterized protein YaaR (DUF327 family)
MSIPGLNAASKGIGNLRQQFDSLNNFVNQRSAGAAKQINGTKAKTIDFNNLFEAKSEVAQQIPKASKKSNQELKKDFADIQRLGLNIRKHFSPSTVTDYITKVHQFLDDVSHQAYSNESNSENLFEKTNIVNKELDTLADNFFKDQTGELQLVASLDKIEGILIDVIA